MTPYKLKVRKLTLARIIVKYNAIKMKYPGSNYPDINKKHLLTLIYRAKPTPS